MKIPQIIHQIYDNPLGVPNILSNISESWKSNHPAWTYRLWNNESIEIFLTDFFPKFIPIYNSFLHDKQRWELLRYLILYKEGGLYVDIDYECIQPVDSLLKNHLCCLGLEPTEHAKRFGKKKLIGNAMLATVPYHPFFEKIINEVRVLNERAEQTSAKLVSQITGVEMLNSIYQKFGSKKEITLLPPNLIAPLSAREISLLLLKRETVEMEDKVENAFAIHYYLGLWRLKSISNM